MRTFALDAEQWIDKPVEDVFAFFSNPTNLQRITPPWLDFEVLDPQGIALREGTQIDYRLRIHGFPLRWRSRISVWEPPRRFVDEQIRGPYRKWVHEHTFEPSRGGTTIRDRVIYSVPGGLLVQRLFVGRDVERIFRFRRETLARLFAR